MYGSTCEISLHVNQLATSVVSHNNDNNYNIGNEYFGVSVICFACRCSLNQFLVSIFKCAYRFQFPWVASNAMRRSRTVYSQVYFVTYTLVFLCNTSYWLDYGWYLFNRVSVYWNCTISEQYSIHSSYLPIWIRFVRWNWPIYLCKMDYTQWF